MTHNKRKSMRHAADPCLGFYLSTSQPSVRPPGPVPDPSSIQTISSDHRSFDNEGFESAVTVDAFLRRSLPGAKTYSKKNRRRLNRDILSSSENIANSTDDNQESVLEARSSHRRANRPRSQSKSLKKHLLNAAVLTHSDPGEWLWEEDAPFQSRNPLPFVEQQSPCKGVRMKRRTWSLVDPRKALPPRSNSFSTRNKPLTGVTLKTDTLSGWQPTYGLHEAAIHKRKDRKASKLIQALKCLPLSFVPLHEAERSYSLMRIPHKPAAVVPKPRVSAVELPKACRVPLDFSSVYQHTSPPRASWIAHEISQQELPPSSHSPLVTTLAAALLSPSAENPPPATTRSSLPHSPSVFALANCEPTPSLPPSHVSKNMKPLPFFFNQLLENARSATQLEKTKKKKAPSKVIPPQINHPESISMKPFLRRSARPTSLARQPAPLSDSRLFSPFAAEVSTSSDGGRPAFPSPSRIAPPFHVSSSPNIHGTLQHTPYQVVLTSTPPNSRSDPTLHSNDVEMAIDTLDSSVNLFCFNSRICKLPECSF
ncbi:hypothetical protein B0H17DRAFT_525264 [Mycena rosella]|uniref:Uncharacterized protein n=1 Tax=Mycena rosella TaxID=1033263 RepID=A0AAD7GY77_MYCRO|nr:hypothetical protein B0H17DRAFT_525264 [Mycena rosella]